MPVTPADILALGTTLQKCATECEWRASVSRAYYAALHEAIVTTRGANASKYLLDTSAWQAGYSTKIVQSFTFARAHLTVKSAGYMLDQLRKDRVAADYYIDQLYLQKNALAAIAQAQRIMSKLALVKALP
jgi:uncharacterized protein (UPF0332 family)